MNNLLIIIYFIPAYLVGSISGGVIISKLVLNEDIRKHGSGNIGATNVARTLGYEWGLLTVSIDIFKAVVPLLVLKYFILTGSLQDTYILCGAGFFILLGHIYPVFLKFRGGKGVAVFIGMMLVLLPLETLIFLALYVIIAAITRYASLSSMISVAVFPVIIIFLNRVNAYILPYIILSVLLAIIIVIKHKENIVRLKNGVEHKFSFKKKEQSDE